MTAFYNYISLESGEFIATSSNADISKTKNFSGFFIGSVKCTLNLEYFLKKDQSHSLSITEINNCKTISYLSVKKGHLPCNASAANMLTGLKQCSNLHGTTFILLFH